MLHRLKSDPRIDSLIAEQRLRILVFGEGNLELQATGSRSSTSALFGTTHALRSSTAPRIC